MIRYIVKLCAIILMALPFYLLLRRPWRRMPENDSQVKEEVLMVKKGEAAGKHIMTKKLAVVRETAMGCFVLFTVGLLALALEGEYGSPARMFAGAAERLATGEGINVVPFRTITVFFKHLSMDIFMVNIIGNIVMFMPWGFGLVLLWKSKQGIWKIILYSLLLTFFIEGSQLFIGRGVDVDDLILNFAGSCLGAGLCFLLRRKYPWVAKLAQ